MCDCQLAVKIVLELCIGILHDGCACSVFTKQLPRGVRVGRKRGSRCYGSCF